MALYFIVAVDGKDIAADLGNQWKSHCDRVYSISLDEVSTKCNTSEPCVLCVIVTPLMLKRLQNSRHALLQTALDRVEHKIFLYKGCATTDAEQLNGHINRSLNDGVIAPIHLQLNTDEDYDNAELKVRSMMRKAKNETHERPPAKKFIVHPEKVTEGTVDVKIIIIQDNRSYSNITVRIPTVTGEVAAQKLSDGTWTLKIPDLKPGEHNINVTADSTDLGSARLTAMSKVGALFEILPDAVREYPVELISYFFRLDTEDFDSELVDFSNDGTESCAFYKCLDYILEKGGTGETCLHMCARHDLPLTCKRILDRRHDPGMKDRRDSSGKTPLDIAKEKKYEDIQRLLRTCEIDDIPSLPPPSRNPSFRDEQGEFRPRLRKSSSTDEPDQPRPRLRKTSSTDEPDQLRPRVRKTSVSSTVSSDSIPEDSAAVRKNPKHSQLTRGTHMRLRMSQDSQDSGTGSAGSRGSQTTQDNEILRQTQLLEEETVKINFQKGQRAEHTYAEIENATPNMQLRGARAERPYAEIENNQPNMQLRGARAERPYQEIDVVEATPSNVQIRPTRSEKPYDAPWHPKDLPIGPMPGRDRTTSTNL